MDSSERNSSPYILEQNAALIGICFIFQRFIFIQDRQVALSDLKFSGQNASTGLLNIFMRRQSCRSVYYGNKTQSWTTNRENRPMQCYSHFISLLHQVYIILTTPGNRCEQQANLRRNRLFFRLTHDSSCTIYQRLKSSCMNLSVHIASIALKSETNYLFS